MKGRMMPIDTEHQHYPDIQTIQARSNYYYTPCGIRSPEDAFCFDYARPAWSAPPFITVPRRPEPLIPDITRERMFEIDGITLAALRPFEKHAKAASNPPQPPPPSPADQSALHNTPSPVLLHDRRKALSLAQLITHGNEAGVGGGRCDAGGRSGNNGNGTVISPPALAAAFGYSLRRQSAPSLRHVTSRPRLATLPTETLVAPIRLGRPLEPLKGSSGIEIWWPATSAGSIKVHVFISSWLFANPEKLTRNFDLPQLYASTAPEPSTDEKSLSPSPTWRGVTVSCPTPGAILPIPGDTPSHDIAPRRRFSNASPHTPTISAFVSGRKTYQNEFPPEAIGGHNLPSPSPLHPCILHMLTHSLRGQTTRWRESISQFWEPS